MERNILVHVPIFKRSRKGRNTSFITVLHTLREALIWLYSKARASRSKIFGLEIYRCKKNSNSWVHTVVERVGQFPQRQLTQEKWKTPNPSWISYPSLSTLVVRNFPIEACMKSQLRHLTSRVPHNFRASPLKPLWKPMKKTGPINIA